MKITTGIKHNILKAFALTALVCLVASISTRAGNISTSVRIYTPPGGPLTPGDSIRVDLVPKTGSNFKDEKVNDLLTLGVDINYPFPPFTGLPMTVKLHLHIHPFNQNNVSQPDFYQDLTVTYNPNDTTPATDRAAYLFQGGYRYDVSIKQIYVNGVPTPNLPKNIYLDGNITAIRDYDFVSQAVNPVSPSSITITPADKDCDGTNDELDISWPTVPGAEQYQLEWAFVNDYGTTPLTYLPSSSLAYDFRHNSTRISTENNYYEIPLIFEHGYVIFRVRGVGTNMNNPGQIIYQVWSSPDAGTVNNVASQFYVTSPHENKMDWQFTATYAEEGKKKEVISYFDGSLRNRQTVTRINTDNDAIVGQTIYDFQGRPAVTVLPSPVPIPKCGTESILKFYPKFNRDVASQAYSANDFDIDNPADSCSATAAAMDSSVSGASNYYSSDNPDQTGFQAFVPDGQGYPFSEVEYTPDNTGRIEKQGGVGPTFQIGNGHETDYFYGQPNQIELDRLFGSEAGYASHYKKNVVIDPNGQASVTYLDQEGRTVATALAGSNPANLQPISSELPPEVPFTVDLFDKDANGHSDINTVNIDNNAIVFNSQLLVAYTTKYSFDYNMQVDTMGDACLADGICFSCVYDLDIELKDDCGNIIQHLVKQVGHFVPTANGAKFILHCDSTAGNLTTDNEDFSPNTPVTLSPGNYTISKTLTVDKDAVNFYVNSYLDSTVNKCAKTLYDFEEEELAKTDTMDCYINCSTCEASLGTRDDFVASGKGTAFDYDRLYDLCAQPCKQVSPCDEAYQAMLADVSPNGQYAEYMVGANVDPSNYPLSVLNENNVLPYSTRNGSPVSWRTPLVLLNNNYYPYYLDDDNKRSEIFVSPDGSGNYIPKVVNPSLVYTDPSSGNQYTYPENLQNLTDFIGYWRPSWARSLVVYHPEYPYYQTCQQYDVQQTSGDYYTSDQFDELLLSTKTFAAAVAANLIPANYLSLPTPDQRVNNWFVIPGGGLPYDPFVVDGAFGPYGTQLKNKFNTYLTFNSGSFSMIEAAAAQVRCGALYGIAPNSSCTQFGLDYDALWTMHQNDSIRDEEWNTLKNYYLSAKQQLQNERADNIAFSSYRDLNDCIGQSSYTPPSYFWSNPLSSSPEYDAAEPCGAWRAYLYANKVKRFPDYSDFPAGGANNVGYQIYLQTGQCPNALNLQALLSSVAGAGKLDSVNMPLLEYPEYTALYLSEYNDAPPQPVTTVAYKWNATDLGNILNVTWTNASNVTECSLSLDKTGTSIPSWQSIIGFSDLKATSVSAGTYYFTIIALVNTINGLTYQTINGSTSCVNIHDCNFPFTCDANSFALDVSKLMSALAVSNNLTSSNVNIHTATYQPIITPNIVNELGVFGNQATWSYSSLHHTFTIYDATQPSIQIRLTIESVVPATFSLSNLTSIQYFDSIQSDYQNFFNIQGRDASGNLLATLHCAATLVNGTDTSQISMGNCGHPQSPNCQGDPYTLFGSLDSLLTERLLHKPFTGNINLFQSPDITPLLRSYFADSTSAGYYHSYTINANLHSDTLVDTMAGCKVILWHHDNNSPPHVFGDLTSLSGFSTIGATNDQNNYQNFYFIATYTNGGPDTIFGTSCLPLRQCEPCADSTMTQGSPSPIGGATGNNQAFQNGQIVPIANASQQVPLTPSAIAYADSIDLANGVLVTDSSVSNYNSYVTAVDSLNARLGLTPVDSGYIKPCCYTEFYSSGITVSMAAYLATINNFIPGIDSQSTVSSPDTFMTCVGGVTDVMVKYNRYAGAVTQYNIRAAGDTLPLLSIISDTVFAENLLADSVCSYINYLQQYPTVTHMPAQDVLTYMKLNHKIDSLAPNDTSYITYESYVSSYLAFVARQKKNNTCLEYQQFDIFYSYGDFKNNHLYCTNQGLAAANDYIAAVNDTNDCPGSLPMMSSCVITNPKVNQAECDKNYVAYRSLVNRFNNSLYASLKHVQLNANLYPLFTTFERAGLCNCVQAYIQYLAPYLATPPDTNLPPPVSIDQFGPCQVTGPLPQDTCATAYQRYLTALMEYNQYVLNNPKLGFTVIQNQYTADQFTANGYCYCVDAFQALVNAILNGNYNSDPQQVIGQLYIGRTCQATLPVGCTPKMGPIDTAQSPSYVPPNPCVAQALGQAFVNAQNDYQQYRDSMTTYIAAKYMKHCLGALENFTENYDEKEYHFTLYYYDQGGNLIKTVPPEGVDPLPITSYTDPTEVQVNQDRTNGTQTVFTAHRMATRYEYNSLNQLTRQYIPDHDPMNIWSTTLPNGLDSRLHVTRTQFVTATRGYLTGYINITTGLGLPRGELYVTNDGGSTWQRANGTVGADIRKVQFIDANNGYAVGANGTILATTDGGSDWDMLPIFQISTGAGQPLITNNLNDIAIARTTGPPRVDGLAVGNNGLVLGTIDGITFKPLTLAVTHLLPTDSVVSVTFDPSPSSKSFYVAVTRSASAPQPYTVMFRYKVSNSGIWTVTQEANIRTAASLYKVRYYGNVTGQAYAIGTDGTLLQTTNSGTNWYQINTGKTLLFRDQYFMSSTEGIAIADSVPGMGIIYKTTDGGNTWQRLGVPTPRYYTALFPYYLNAGTAKVIAVGPGGVVGRVIMEHNLPWGIVDMPTVPGSPNITAAYGAETSNGLWLYVGGNSANNIFLAQDAESATASWQTLSSGGTPAFNNVTHIQGTVFSGSPEKISAVFIAGGDMFSFNTQDANSNTYSFSQVTPTSGVNFADLNTPDVYHQLYTYDNVSGKLYYMTLINTGPTTTASSLNNSSPVSKVFAISDVQGNSITISGQNGGLARGVISLPPPTPGHVTWTDVSKNIDPLPAQDVKYDNNPNGTAYTVGRKGTIMQRNGLLSPPVWTIMPSGSWTGLNAMQVTASQNGVIVADSGKVYTFASRNPSIMGDTLVALTPVKTLTTEKLYDVAADPTSGTVYVAGAKGTMLYTNNISATNPFTACINTTGNDLYGVGMVPGSTQAYGVGQYGHVRFDFGVTAMTVNQVFTPPMRGVHFSDINNGYVVADNYTVRETTNGGTTWNVVLPATAEVITTLGPNVPTLNTVWNISPGKAMIGGANSYAATVSGTVTTKATVSVANTSFNGVTFLNSSTGYMVGTQAPHTPEVQTTSNGGVTWTSIGGLPGGAKGLNAIYLFKNNNTFVTVGDKNTALYYNSGFTTITLPPIINPASNFNDVTFYDNVHGWIVGSKGMAMSVVSTSPGPNFTLGGIQVTGHATEDGLDVPAETDSLKMNIQSVAVTSLYDGFMGGHYGGKHVYDRKFRDESGEFSIHHWYDQMGRIALTEDTKQFDFKQKAYTYTIYDAIGRVIETGEKFENTGATSLHQSAIFGTIINNFYNPNVMDTVNFRKWMTDVSGAREQVTHTYYDQTPAIIASQLPINFIQAQDNMRKRIATVTYEDKYDGNPATYDYGTHYSYDINGAASSILQDNPDNPITGQRFKRLDYTYDLVSGKTNTFTYQDRQADAWYTKYDYDADNRITDVQTSRDSVLWDEDAKYFYYKHNLLARIEMGNYMVQGLDYVYTLQGWRKGVNSNTLDTLTDPGQDGAKLGQNSSFAKDVYGYSLGYYLGDYLPIGYANNWTPTNRFESDVNPGNNSSDLLNSRNDLFNGNISYMVTSLTDPTNHHTIPQGMGYQYDQLQRLIQAQAYTDIDTINNIWNKTGTYNNAYLNQFTYDENGNILTQVKDDGSGNPVDNLKYEYSKDGSNLLQNRLYNVNNSVSPGPPDQFPQQGIFNASLAEVNYKNNYSYDEIGELKKDSINKIDSITWEINGKIKRIYRNSLSIRDNIKFDYDPSGNIIDKQIFDHSGNLLYTLYYVRDSQGNIISVYLLVNDNIHHSQTYSQIERGIYGDKRRGEEVTETSLIGSSPPPLNDVILTHSLGEKRYELDNHLGSVLAIISDNKQAVQSILHPGEVGSYAALQYTVNDYYPYGAAMEERTFNPNDYRYGFNGKEKNDEIFGAGDCYNYDMRFYDPRLGRPMSIDQLYKKYPMLSCYQFFSDNPIENVDLDGQEKKDPDAGKKNNAGDQSASTDAPLNAKDFPKTTTDPVTGKVYPIHYVFESLTPNIYRHTVNVLKSNPQYNVLKYNGGGAAAKANRKEAIKDCPLCGGSNSRDEFPYASTEEGGAGSSVACVPKSEQAIQGGQLRAVYRNMKAGDQFLVVPVSNEEEKKPIEQPVPQTYPIFNKKTEPTPKYVPVIVVPEALIEILEGIGILAL